MCPSLKQYFVNFLVFYHRQAIIRINDDIYLRYFLLLPKTFSNQSFYSIAPTAFLMRFFEIAKPILAHGKVVFRTNNIKPRKAIFLGLAKTRRN